VPACIVAVTPPEEALTVAAPVEDEAPVAGGADAVEAAVAEEPCEPDWAGLADDPPQPRRARTTPAERTPRTERSRRAARRDLGCMSDMIPVDHDAFSDRARRRPGSRAPAAAAITPSSG